MKQFPRGAVWAAGAAYEPYVGRWSRVVARDFLPWLGVARGGRWLDVGCGTGALTGVALEMAAPASILGLDPAPGFLRVARAQVRDRRAAFALADARALPLAGAACDVAVSGLALNFVPDPERAARELRRVVRPGGRVAAYVWDYGGDMQMMRHFWDAAVALDPAAVDEGPRFPLCRPEPLAALWRAAGLTAVQTRPIDAPTRFRDFDDYWRPFLGGQGPAPAYAMSLGEDRRAALRERIRAGLPIAADGSIALIARAWAVQGTVPATGKVPL
jgi:SAM-dependent methyltransferase